MEATPRPWKLIGKTRVRGANGEFVGLLMDVSNQSPTDADFAIRAVNAHDRLIEALELEGYLVELISGEHIFHLASCGNTDGVADCTSRCVKARAALALARGEVEE